MKHTPNPSKIPFPQGKRIGPNSILLRIHTAFPFGSLNCSRAK